MSEWVLWLPSTVQRRAVSGVRLIGDYKLPAGVNVSVISRCVNPEVNRRR